MSHTPLPTLQDVADLAAVSTATVSRCLNKSGHVTEKTRLKVQQAIQTLGYSPNFGAQALAAKRTNTIGAIALASKERSKFLLDPYVDPLAAPDVCPLGVATMR